LRLSREQEPCTVQHDLDLIGGLEEALFKQSVRGSPEAVNNLLADNFVEFGRSGGIHKKNEVVQSLAAESAEPLEALTARDFVLTPLADDVGYPYALPAGTVFSSSCITAVKSRAARWTFPRSF
jgi:hypothetical protein